MGLQLLISCSDDNPDTETGLVKTLISRNVEAIISVSTLSDDRIYRDVEALGTPVVLLDRHRKESELDVIVSDDKSAAKALAQTLFANTQHEVVYFGGTETLVNSRLRLAGFQQALESLENPTVYAKIHHRDFSVEAGFKMLEDYYQKHQCLPERLFTASFTLMEGALQFSRLHLKDMPEDLEWATFGDNYILDLLPFTIHSAKQQYELMAEQALLNIDSKLNSNKGEGSIILERTIIKRHL